MYEHVIVGHPILYWYWSTASTEQHIATISQHKAATQVRDDQGSTTQASR